MKALRAFAKAESQATRFRAEMDAFVRCTPGWYSARESWRYYQGASDALREFALVKPLSSVASPAKRANAHPGHSASIPCSLP